MDFDYFTLIDTVSARSTQITVVDLVFRGRSGSPWSTCARMHMLRMFSGFRCSSAILSVVVVRTILQSAPRCNRMSGTNNVIMSEEKKKNTECQWV